MADCVNQEYEAAFKTSTLHPVFKRQRAACSGASLRYPGVAASSASLRQSPASSPSSLHARKAARRSATWAVLALQAL